jgi:hypothetical protein
VKTYYLKNPDAGKNNGGYSNLKELVKTLFIEKNGITIELTGEETAELYNFIKPCTAPKID